MSRTVAEAIDTMVESYPRLNGSHPSSWFHVKKDGTIQHEFILQACHAAMSYRAAKGCMEIYTVLLNKHPGSMDYINALLTGPFRAFADKIAIETHEESGEFYAHLTALDSWPANVMFNFLVASRVPIEKMDILECWNWLVAAGVDKHLALLVSGHNIGEIEGKIPWEFRMVTAAYNKGHFWLNTPASNWKRVMTGDVNVKNCHDPYYVGGGTTPCNVIWDQCDRAEWQKLTAMNVTELSAYFGLNGPPVEVPEPVEVAKPVRQYKRRKPVDVAMDIEIPRGGVLVNEIELAWPDRNHHGQAVNPFLNFDLGGNRRGAAILAPNFLIQQANLAGAPQPVIDVNDLPDEDFFDEFFGDDAEVVQPV